MTINSEPFGKSPDGNPATVWTLTNDSGLSIRLSDWGATIISVMQPDKNGTVKNVALGFGHAGAYRSEEGYLGATCGRFANRIAGGKFTLNGRKYSLFCNDGNNHLHGGEYGYNFRLWKASPYSEGDKSGVVFSYRSPDGEEGYPGNLEVRADYSLDEKNRLYMDFHAETDAPTIVNLTNHAYWNLGGAGSGSTTDHVLKLFASHYIPVDDEAIPTGAIAEVKNTAFDFRQAKTIAEDLAKVPGGFDHCWVIDGPEGKLRNAAELHHPGSGRTLLLQTDRPGVQFYSGNFLSGSTGAGGAVFEKHGGICLEPEDFPDAPNNPDFPSTVVYPDKPYRHRSTIDFTAR